MLNGLPCFLELIQQLCLLASAPESIESTFCCDRETAGLGTLPSHPPDAPEIPDRALSIAWGSPLETDALLEATGIFNLVIHPIYTSYLKLHH